MVADINPWFVCMSCFHLKHEGMKAKQRGQLINMTYWPSLAELTLYTTVICEDLLSKKLQFDLNIIISSRKSTGRIILLCSGMFQIPKQTTNHKNALNASLLCLINCSVKQQFDLGWLFSTFLHKKGFLLHKKGFCLVCAGTNRNYKRLASFQLDIFQQGNLFL